MADPAPQPIEINPSPLPDQIWAAVRQIVPIVVTFALAKGWIGNDLAALIAGLLGILWPLIAGQLKTRRRATELVTVGASPEVPDHIAHLKEPGA